MLARKIVARTSHPHVFVDDTGRPVLVLRRCCRLQALPLSDAPAFNRERYPQADCVPLGAARPEDDDASA